ncbi:unnamed protein product [Polarella glacialis]|uniref:Uncharacterized protein n=1 Tax=Polarella glacialis TaxID=89957 RepID=A0A813E5B2_POLGL|nr:unnamed protein product [Polarella glacialis]
MFAAGGAKVVEGTEGGKNWLRCPECSSRARPTVLMFDDEHWLGDSGQELRWAAWCKAVKGMASASSRWGNGRLLRTLILEIGCGLEVPTVRNTAEDLAAVWSEAGAEVTLVRVNPVSPQADQPLPARVRYLALPCRGIEAILKMQAHLDSFADGGAAGALAENSTPLNNNNNNMGSDDEQTFEAGSLKHHKQQQQFEAGSLKRGRLGDESSPDKRQKVTTTPTTTTTTTITTGQQQKQQPQ